MCFIFLQNKIMSKKGKVPDVASSPLSSKLDAEVAHSSITVKVDKIKSIT